MWCETDQNNAGKQVNTLAVEEQCARPANPHTVESKIWDLKPYLKPVNVLE